MKEVVIGIDLGGTNTAIGIVDFKGNILHTFGFKTEDAPNPEIWVNLVKHHLTPYLNLYNIKGIGIGAPNGNYYKGDIEFAPNLTWKGIIPLTQLVKESFKLPTCLTNDANAAALGEMIFGGAKGLKNFIEITIGTGLGSAFVANGSLIYGSDGFAGELGHVVVIPNGRTCTCGLKGCVETYVSSRGIKQTMNELIQVASRNDKEFWSNKELDAKTIFNEANNGNPLALMTFELTGNILGQALAKAVSITSPSHIFLFGGIVNAGKILLEPAEKSMNENVINVFRNKVNLCVSSLQDKNAAILGASALIINEINIV